MTSSRAHPEGESVDGNKFHSVQPERDLEANWEVDLSKKLEEYLLKICSGEITANEEDGQVTVNFAEAALLLQGSVQVYSRKVEYLYNLVLHALEFLTQQRQKDQKEDTLVQSDESCSLQASDEDDDLFWNVDDIPADPKNYLDNSSGKDDYLNYFVKPPANLVVLEADSLDSAGGDGELESYLLATTHLYREFILLDPHDAPVVDEFLDGSDADKERRSAHKPSTSRRSFSSAVRRSGGTAQKSSLGKNQDGNCNLFPGGGFGSEYHNCDVGSSFTPDNFGDIQCGFNMDDRCGTPVGTDGYNSDSNDNPWKPLNPYESGTLKVKPFRKVKAFRQNAVKPTKNSLATLFPLAGVARTVCPELTEWWKIGSSGREKMRDSQDFAFYEKLRQSLLGVDHICDAYDDTGNQGDVDQDNDGMPDIEHMDGQFSGNMYMDEDILHQNENMNNDNPADFDIDEAFENGEPSSQASLEDLCRTHLDALLATIAETEKQTELAARVSSWKQKIEYNLKEQDSRPPFDIHAYGDTILEKLSLESETGDVIPFSNVVVGQKRHEVCRTFSALLQLVNNGDVDLEKTETISESVCYSAGNPFGIRLLKNRGANNNDRRPRLPKKRAGDKDCLEGEGSSGRIPYPEHGSIMRPSRKNRKAAVKIRRSTPEGKKRRKSQLVEPVVLDSF